jgi:DNA-directed RNA polymerase specialized sigma24 family protein
VDFDDELIRKIFGPQSEDQDQDETGRRVLGESLQVCDEDLYEQLVRRITPTLRRFARIFGFKYLRNESEIDGLVQDTLVRLTRSGLRAQLPSQGSVERWCYVTMRRLSLDLTRYLVRHPAILLEVGDTALLPLGEDKTVMTATTGHDLSRALQALDDTKRDLMLLVD